MAWSARSPYMGVSDHGFPGRRPMARSSRDSLREASPAGARDRCAAGALVTYPRQPRRRTAAATAAWSTRAVTCTARATRPVAGRFPERRTGPSGPWSSSLSRTSRCTRSRVGMAAASGSVLRWGSRRVPRRRSLRAASAARAWRRRACKARALAWALAVSMPAYQPRAVHALKPYPSQSCHPFSTTEADAPSCCRLSRATTPSAHKPRVLAPYQRPPCQPPDRLTARDRHIRL